MYRNIQVQGTEIVQAYDGMDAWMINPFAGGKDPVKMTPDESKEITDRNFEDELIDYKSKGHELTLQGTEDVEGAMFASGTISFLFSHRLITKNSNGKKMQDLTGLILAKGAIPGSFLTPSEILNQGPGLVLCLVSSTPWLNDEGNGIL